MCEDCSEKGATEEDSERCVKTAVIRGPQKRRVRGQYLKVKLVTKLESGHLLVELLQLCLGGRALDGLLRQVENSLRWHRKAHPLHRQQAAATDSRTGGNSPGNGSLTAKLPAPGADWS